MTAKTTSRGWRLAWRNDRWVYEDTSKPFDNSRPCKRCNRPATAEDHDACLGRLPGIGSACCGHGVEEGFALERERQ